MTIRPKNSLVNTKLSRPFALDSQPRDPNLLWLDKNENFDKDLLALSSEVLASIPSSAVASYPEAGDLYRKLGKWINVDPEGIILTPGSDGAIRLVYDALFPYCYFSLSSNYKISPSMLC